MSDLSQNCQQFMANIDIFLADLHIFWSNFFVTGVFPLFEHFPKKLQHKCSNEVWGGVEGYLNNVKKNYTFGWRPRPLRFWDNIFLLQPSQKWAVPRKWVVPSLTPDICECFASGGWFCADASPDRDTMGRSEHGKGEEIHNNSPFGSFIQFS